MFPLCFLWKRSPAIRPTRDSDLDPQDISKQQYRVHAMTSSAFILIDAQVNMFDPSNPVGSAVPLLARLVNLAERSRAANVPIVFVRNCGKAGDPDERGKPGWELHPSLRPEAGDLVLDKTASDTFASTSLGDELKSRGITHLVIAGLQSEYCVRATTLGALARNFEVTLVTDGHSTYDGSGRSALQKSAAINKEFEGRVKLTNAADVRFP
jgi:nicotinamidase-related amidase